MSWAGHEASSCSSEGVWVAVNRRDTFASEFASDLEPASIAWHCWLLSEVLVSKAPVF